jgi:hypothetical protein
MEHKKNRGSDHKKHEHKLEEHKEHKKEVHHVGPVSHVKHQHKEDQYSKFILPLIVIAALLIIFNQVQVGSINNAMGDGTSFGGLSSRLNLKSSGDLSSVDVTQIQSTAQGIAALFPVDKIKTSQDAIDVMIPTGTPDYGAAMGVSFDDPVGSMEKMAKTNSALTAQVKKDNPEAWQRYLNLASKPRGVSCEFCCGLGAAGADANGRSACGCQHNPALLTLTLWLLDNTDYSDAEVLREVYKWKTLFFPKNMVGLASQIAGGDTSVLENLPGMVGGC